MAPDNNFSNFSMKDKISTLTGNWTAAQLTMLKDFSAIEKQRYLAWLRAMVEVARLPYLSLGEIHTG